MKRVLVLMCLLACCVLRTMAAASVPSMINYQGKLMQPSGAPVPDGTYSIRFAIYDVPTGGEPLWSETNQSVQVKGGLFATMLGSVVNLPANIFESPNRFFGVKVGDDPEMTPRQRIGSVAYAQVAGNGVPPGAILSYGGIIPPTGWLLCDGQAVSRDVYAALFSVIGTTYGNGDGSTTFNLPDTRGRFPIGKDMAYPLASFGGSTTKDLQHEHGTQVHVLSVNEMPSHGHGVNDPGHSHSIKIDNNGTSGGGSWIIGGGNWSATYTQTSGTGISIQHAGGSGGHSHGNTTKGLSTSQDVLNPYISFNYIIKL